MSKAVINLQKESGGIVKISPVDGTGVTEVTVPESGNLVSVGTAVTDNAIARYNGTTGELQNSGVVIDDSGNVGIGVTPSASGSVTHGIQTEYNYMGSLGGGGKIMYNAVPSSNSDSKYVYSSLVAVAYEQNASGQHIWKTAPAGTAGNPITWTNAMTLAANGNLLLTSGTGALGYGAGAGGTVTQLTSKSTAVTLNKPCGRINTHNSELAAGETVDFQLNNSLLSEGDGVIVSNINYVGYSIRVGVVSDGVAYIYITNIQPVNGSHIIPIKFQVIKGSNY